jgi:enamine deaminase RidA (YjgF/YER057c/UK114 family)
MGPSLSSMLDGMHVERQLAIMGLTLPAPAEMPGEVQIPFQWVRVSGSRAYLAGHGALAADGTPHGPFGKVPSEVSLQEAQHSARLATLAMLSSLKAALGGLDRVEAWLVVNGFVNADPGYGQTTTVLNPCSELILQLYGSQAGAHARTAIGAATLPLNLPVVISAEVEISTGQG